MRQTILSILFMLIFVSIFSIQVSGQQSGDWSSDNNPYQIVGDVTIPNGQTLTLMPGVIVEAMGNYQIIAQGNIVANGTEVDSIKFLSGLPDQTTIWKGIRLENTTVQSQFSYCRIELGQYGIHSINSPVSITYCIFNKNQKGIQAYGIGSANPADVLIDHCLLEFSQQSGIYVAQNSNTTITYNDITRNGTSGAYYGSIHLTNQSAGGSNSPEIAYNHIHNNYMQGIIAWDSYIANAIQPEIHDNLIENNLTGIYLRDASGYVHHNTIINNFIPGNMNSGAGVMVSRSTSQPYFENNIITGNYTGFYLTENANPIIGDLSIWHAWAQGENTIANNIDANNVLHSIVCYQYTAATFTVKAENNYWDYNNATQIDQTITDFYDNPAFPTIDYTPWLNNAIPIYLAGTIISNNPQLTSATLELVSAQTGNIIDNWSVTVNEPFQVPVYHDSLVYIVARGTDLSQVQYMAAYGGLQNPTSAQIIADVQFSIGDLTLTNELPDWYYRRFCTPQTINGHLSYPLEIGWFVFAPELRYFLYRDGDFLRLSRFECIVDSISFNLANPLIWLKIDNLESDSTWEQISNINFFNQQISTLPTHAKTGISTFVNGQPNLYDMIQIGANDYLQVFDHNSSNWLDYKLTDDGVMDMRITVPNSVEPDGTLFPLQTGNIWRTSLPQQYTVPTYFGYRTDDSLSFYWIPPRSGMSYVSYRLFNNGVQIVELPLTAHSYTIPIPYDGMEHTFTISAWDGTNNNYALTPIVLVFTQDIDEVIAPHALSVYPNPFNPNNNSLTLKLDNSKAPNTEIKVYNLKGQLVWKADIKKDTTEMKWNGKDTNGRICASGLYHIQVSDNKGRKANRKLILIH